MAPVAKWGASTKRVTNIGKSRGVASHAPMTRHAIKQRRQVEPKPMSVQVQFLGALADHIPNIFTITMLPDAVECLLERSADSQPIPLVRNDVLDLL